MPSLKDQLNKPEEVQQSGATYITQAENKDLQYAAETLFQDENLLMKTDLNVQQITALARGHVFAELYQSPTMANLCHVVESLLISKGRKGRAEMVDITKQIRSDMPAMPKSPLSHLMGGL